MNHLIATLVVGFTILGAVTATFNPIVSRTVGAGW
jgi:hypothetical protein